MGGETRRRQRRRGKLNRAVEATEVAAAVEEPTEAEMAEVLACGGYI